MLRKCLVENGTVEFLMLHLDEQENARKALEILLRI
jgi:hypothetical protein